MNKTNLVIIYLIIFFFVAIVLRIAGALDLTISDMLCYLFMFSGISAVFYSFGTERKGLIFTGTVFFLISVIIFVTSRFELEETRQIIFISVLFVIGIGFLVLFIDDASQKIYLVLSLIFIASGMIYIIYLRGIVLKRFSDSLWAMIESYWVLLLIITGFLFLLRKKS